MAGYRDTLHLPKTDFPMKADLPNREPQRLAWWKDQDCYGRLREARRGAPVWLLHDGPPYSNGHLHMGTAANKIWKDAAVRCRSLMGFDSPYVPGWDNHGMPIETEVGKQLRGQDGPPDRLTLRRRCREYAHEWVGIQREEFVRLGGWGDWNHPYLTMDHRFEAAILESFAALAERGFIQRGLRSIHWCPTDRTALAEAEIEYQDDASASIHVAFPLRSDPNGTLAAHAGVEAVAWTTTPWTLPANLGLMVDPEADYVVVRVATRRFLVARPRLEAVSGAAGWTSPAVEATIHGRALIGTVFEGPWGGDSRVVDGTPHVSMDDGTGLVHTAPGHGKEDFAVGQRAGLGVLCPVDSAGRFTEGAEPFVGRSVLDVNDDIVTWLKERGRLVASGHITHAYPHCWRCRRPVIFRATHQWFMIIDHDGHRERAIDRIANTVRWDPPNSENRIRESVRGRPDWCLSRQRSWGVGIPALYCESCDAAVLDPAVMRRAAETTRELGSDAWYELPVERFTPPDFACPHCGGGGPFRKETDILDVWFDSGSTHRAIRATHPELAAAWQRADTEDGRVVYFEGPDQHRGWFNSSLMVSVGIEGRAPYTDVLTHGWVLDGQGRAMHKSLGNVIAPADVVKRSGADIVRWWALATDWRTDVRVGDEILQRVSDAYRKVRNTFRFLLGNLHDFDPARDAVAEDALTRVDRAYLDALRSSVERIWQSYDKLEFHRAVDLLLNVCTVDLSAVYLDVTKDRLYTLAAADPRRRSAQTVMWRALHDLCIAAAPALVFTAEEVWQSHPALTREWPSVHPAWPSVHHAVRRPDPAARLGEVEWEFLLRVRAVVNAAIEPLRADKRLSTTAEASVRIFPRSDQRALLELYGDELADFLIVSEVSVSAENRLEAELQVTDRPAREFEVEVAITSQPKCERCWRHRPSGTRPGLCARCVEVLAAAETATG